MAERVILNPTSLITSELISGNESDNPFQRAVVVGLSLDNSAKFIQLGTTFEVQSTVEALCPAIGPGTVGVFGIEESARMLKTFADGLSPKELIEDILTHTTLADRRKRAHIEGAGLEAYSGAFENGEKLFTSSYAYVSSPGQRSPEMMQRGVWAPADLALGKSWVLGTDLEQWWKRFSQTAKRTRDYQKLLGMTS